MLRLYCPSKQVAWLLDELKDASIHLKAALYRMQRIFVHSYMNENGEKKSKARE